MGPRRWRRTAACAAPGRRAEPGHDGRGDRRDAAADENFDPGHARRVEKPAGHRAHAAGLGKRDERRQRLIRAMPPARCGEPAEFSSVRISPSVRPACRRTITVSSSRRSKLCNRSADDPIRISINSCGSCAFMRAISTGSSGPATWSLTPIVTRCRAPVNKASARQKPAQTPPIARSPISRSHRPKDEPAP